MIVIYKFICTILLCAGIFLILSIFMNKDEKKKIHDKELNE